MNHRSIGATLFVGIALTFFSSCIGKEGSGLELDTIFSIESYNTKNSSLTIILENSLYPCVDQQNCQPSILETAVVQLTGSISGTYDADLNPTSSIFVNDQIDFQPGEEVTINVRVPNNRSFSATEIYPDTLDAVLEARYARGTDNPGGLFLFIDREELAKSDGLHVTLYILGSVPARYGFIISNDSFPQDGCLRYGGFQIQNENIYRIEQAELDKLGINPVIGEEFIVFIRNYSRESLNYLHQYNRSLCDEPIDINEGTLFAPPRNLPTNFSDGAFGYFHVFTEETETGVVEEF